MPSARRTSYAFYYCEDDDTIDIPALLRGELVLRTEPRLVALSILTGQEHELSLDELHALLRIPSERWVELNETGVDAAHAEALARKGLLLTDPPHDGATELRRRDEQLSSSYWHVYAALHHFMTKWRDVGDADELDASALDGCPPPAFHSVANVAGGEIRLPLTTPRGPLYDVLGRRRTVRDFASGAAISSGDLATILRVTFGAYAYARTEHLVALRKTSPSGGALHPTEVYPVIRNVDGVAPGLYHYRVEHHTLEPIRLVGDAELRALCETFAAGQAFAADAHALFVLATRFRRSFWKYRQHKRAYAVLLMDAAHLSQTFQLVCADLGLGAFVTAAINAANVEDALALDPYEQGVLAICGCGVAAGAAAAGALEFSPYKPGDTRI
jgi:putative peptide maturation dehydrogenase